MKVLLLFCVIVQLTRSAPSPPFTTLFSGLLGGGGGGGSGGLLSSLSPLSLLGGGSPLGGLFGGGSTSDDDDSDDSGPSSFDAGSTSSSDSESSGGFLSSEVGQRFLGDLFGVKSNLFGALRDTIRQQGNNAETGEHQFGVVDGMGGGITGTGTQMFSAGAGFENLPEPHVDTSSSISSGFSQHESFNSASASGSSTFEANQGSAIQEVTGFGAEGNGASSAGNGFSQSVGGGVQTDSVGYQYNRPQSDSGVSNGYNNGGYQYRRPQANGGVSSGGYAPSNGGASYRGASPDFVAYQGNAGDVGPPGIGLSLRNNVNGANSVAAASRSGTAGFSSQNNFGDSLGSAINSGVQIPIHVLNQYRNGINRGFDSVSSGINTLQTLFQNLGAPRDNNRIDTDSRKRY